MNNEIKEILDEMISSNDYQDYKIYGKRLKEIGKQLLDYITNLQEENENKDNKIIELQQELLNKKLNVKDIEYKEKMIYKSRIDKAIEYIKKDWYELNTRDIEHCINLNKDIRIDLLNILKGE